MSAITRFAVAAMVFVVDLASLIRDTGRQVDWDLITDVYKRGVFTVKLNGAVTAAAVSITVDTLENDVKKGDTLDFGNNDIVKATANADAGATVIAITAAPTGIADNAVASVVARLYEGQNRDALFIPAGTVMVEVDATTNRKIIPLALHASGVSANGQAMVALTDMKNDSRTDALTGYGVTFAGVLYENLMPDAIKNGGVMPTGWKTFLGARYVWKVSRDSRGA